MLGGKNLFDENEKVICTLTSGFKINGYNEFDSDGAILNITSLGKIYFSKGHNCDVLIFNKEELTEKIISNFDGEYLNLVSLDTKVIHVNNNDEDEISTCNNKVSKNIVEKNGVADLFIVLNLEVAMRLIAFSQISWFNVSRQSVILLDNELLLGGNIEIEEQRIVFSAERGRYEFRIDEIESFNLNQGILKINGYFYIDMDKTVYRKITIMSKKIKKILHKRLDNIIKQNPKIGQIPSNDIIEFCKISGRIDEKDYLEKNMFFIKHEDLYVLYEKHEKREILCKNIKELSVVKFDNTYIIYDEKNIFTIDINKKSVKKLGFEKIKTIKNDYIGISKGGKPFFFEVSEDYLKLKKSEDKLLLVEKVENITKIEMDNRLSKMNGNYVGVKIAFKYSYISFYMKKKILGKLSTEILLDDSKISLNNLLFEELYDSWVKTISDMLVYNFFAKLYDVRGKYKEIKNDKISFDNKVDFINNMYSDMQKNLKEIDIVTVYMSELLENNEARYFRKKGLDYNCEYFNKLERLLFNFRSDIKLDLTEIIRSIEAINFVILPEGRRKFLLRTLKEREKMEVEFFINQAFYKLEHLIYDILPHYIARILKGTFEVYNKIKINYIGYEELCKEDIIERIKSAYEFKQYPISSESDILRKEVIKELYSLMKLGISKIDSELYYTGGYRNDN